ncbi:MAG TPA: hypothetical protein VLG11_05145 [Candidatus Saccharimonadales bacterium]|nr:hypothetical protein [Candidatus Saccharimonadales bacterium]
MTGGYEPDPNRRFLAEQELAFPLIDLVEYDVREFPEGGRPLPYNVAPEGQEPLTPADVARIALAHVEQNEGEK